MTLHLIAIIGLVCVSLVTQVAVEAESGAELVDPTLCFVKLVPNGKRTKADVEALAREWEGIMSDRFPQMAYKLLTVDRETVAVQTLLKFNAPQLRDFFLELDVVHEVQVETEVFRRPGQQPLQEVKASLAKETRQAKRRSFFQFFRRKRPLGLGRTPGRGAGRGQRNKAIGAAPRRGKQEL